MTRPKSSTRYRANSRAINLYVAEEVHTRLGHEAEIRYMPMANFLRQLINEGLERLKPPDEYNRLTTWEPTLPTYDPTELEKTRVSAGPSKPCSTPIIRLRDRGYAYCPDCGWHVEMHLDA